MGDKHIERETHTHAKNQTPSQLERHTERDTHTQKQKIHTERHTDLETHTEMHRDRQTRGTITLRKTPSSRKKHTLLNSRYIYTHTTQIHTHPEAEKLEQGE